VVRILPNLKIFMQATEYALHIRTNMGIILITLN
jgi:hypothetical protein